MVGDRVTVRTVDEMLESGLFEHSKTDRDLLNPTYTGLNFAFNKRMEYLCGQTGVITQITNRFRCSEIVIEFDDPSITLERDNYRTWHISMGMVKNCTLAVNEDDIFSLLDEF